MGEGEKESERGGEGGKRERETDVFPPHRWLPG